jgi:HPt (histidine-containing phosphotransfer) domain-containing protein
MSESDTPNPSPESSGKEFANDPAQSAAVTDPLEKMLQALWITSKETIDERIKSIRLAHSQARLGILDENTRALGGQAAHKLAGVLGTFGLPRGTEIGRMIEERLEHSTDLARADVALLGRWIDELETVIASKSQG